MIHDPAGLPKFSIVMATLNSTRTLALALTALRDQDYPTALVEVLVVDGGSTDGTREMATAFGYRVIDNPRVEPVSAKLIGLKEATGEYLMYVDSDEVISPGTLRAHATVYKSHRDIRMVFSTGYRNPVDAPFAARYINEYGDPFSMFYYRLSKDARFFAGQIRRMCRVIEESGQHLVLEVGAGRQPILENAACANSMDLRFFRETMPELCDKAWGPVHFFYHMQKFTRRFAVVLGQPVVHHSADHMASFFKKIKWRVRNNVFFRDQLGAAGFTGRVQFDSVAGSVRRYAYLPYAAFAVPMIVDAAYHMWTRRDLAYWLHIPLTIYTAGLIVGMKLGKIMGYRPVLKSYGDQKAISTGPGPSN